MRQALAPLTIGRQIDKLHRDSWARRVIAGCFIVPAAVVTLVAMEPQPKSDLQPQPDRFVELAEKLRITSFPATVADSQIIIIPIDNTLRPDQMRRLMQKIKRPEASVIDGQSERMHGKFELLPNWEIGLDTFILLPNYEAGSVEFPLLGRPNDATNYPSKIAGVVETPSAAFVRDRQLYHSSRGN